MTEFNIEYQRGFINGFNEAKAEFRRPMSIWHNVELGSDLYIRCDNCGYHRSRFTYDKLPNFCENCGADMRGDKE